MSCFENVFGPKFEAFESKLILIKKSFDSTWLQQSTAAIFLLGITNFIIIIEVRTWKIVSLTIYPPTSSLVDLASAKPISSQHFPDLQENLKGYAYKVALTKQFPRIRQH